jgi:hypothetical protein
VFVTRYLTRPGRSAYRISITGDELIMEGAGPSPFTLQRNVAPSSFLADQAEELGLRRADLLGEPEHHESRYAKIGRLSPEDRRKAEEFMLWATLEHRVFSLGRFATWRAGLLLDDLPHDIAKIEGWMQSGNYQIKRSL